MVKILIIFFIIIILLYIYDRNITILDNIDIYNMKNLLDILFSYLDKIFYINYENFNIYNCNKPIGNKEYRYILQKIPDIKCLNTNFEKLINVINHNETNLKPFKSSIQSRIHYYKNKIYKNIYHVLNNEFANNEMVNLIDTQSKIKKIIHDFIFIIPSSNLPIQLQNILDDFNNCFNKINKNLNINNNKKFYDNNQYHIINNKSSFIFNNGFDPVPKNTYYDNLNYY